MDSAYHNPGFSFLLLCCLCLKPSSFLQCLQQHPQQCGPHDAGLSLPPHCVAQGHPAPPGHGDERYLHPGRKHDCLGLSGGREDGVNSKTRVIHNGFPLAFLAGGLNPVFFLLCRKVWVGCLCSCTPQCFTAYSMSILLW